MHGNNPTTICLCAQSIKDLPTLQDAPPPGGFPSIRIERRLPNTGPTGVAIFAGMAAVVGYGFWQAGNSMQHVAHAHARLVLHAWRDGMTLTLFAPDVRS